MMKIGRFVDVDEDLLHANPELLHAPNNSHDNCCWRLVCSPWWLKSSDKPKNFLNWVAIVPNDLSLTFGLKICPRLVCMNPEWTPLGGCAPPRLCLCALVIPPSETGSNRLKLCTLVSFVMGQKGLCGSSSVISLDSQLCLHKCFALSDWKVRPGWFPHENSSRNDSKEAPCFLLKWVGRKLLDVPCSDLADSLSLSNLMPSPCWSAP
jgi:hypothetical protein